MFSWECTNILKQQKQPPEVFRKKIVLKDFAIFTRKHLCWSLLVSLESTLLKKTPIQIFSREYYEIFKNTYFKEHLRTTTS